MRVLIAHVSYREAGGEDRVVATESALLREQGVEVTVHNPASVEFDALATADRMRVAARFADHRLGRMLIRELIVSKRPDVVHFHNIYPLYGPGGIDEAAKLGCAVVQTVHNYRLSCLNGRHFLFDRAAVCTRCRPQRFVPGVLRGCYRDSRVQSAVMSHALAVQWRLLQRGIPHLLLPVGDSVRDRLVAAGVPADRLVVKPNSVDEGLDVDVPREGAVFVGRLSREKGILELVRAWPRRGLRLTIIGDGPLMANVRAAAGPAVRVMGKLPASSVRDELRAARVCVAPSLWFECLPLVMLEALAEGTPVVGFSGTAVESVVRAVRSDLTVPFADMAGLVDRSVRVAADPGWPELSRRCRQIHRQSYSHPANAASLLAIYERVLGGGRATADREGS